MPQNKKNSSKNGAGAAKAAAAAEKNNKAAKAALEAAAEKAKIEAEKIQPQIIPAILDVDDDEDEEPSEVGKISLLTSVSPMTTCFFRLDFSSLNVFPGRI
jgi:hypothetical protein